MTTSMYSGRSAPPLRRWALALLGALLVVAIGQITLSEHIDVVAITPDSQGLTLGGTTTIEQPFRATLAGLAGLTLHIRPGGPADADLQIPIRLRYEGGPPIDLVSMSLPLSAAGDGELRFSFPRPIAPRDPYALSETLRLIIDVPSLPPNSGPALIVQPAPQDRGRLQIDGAPSPGYNLAITLSYQRRWVDRLWPISAMAAGKLGLLGWPPLYALLPYLYAVLLLEGGMALRGALGAPVDA